MPKPMLSIVIPVWNRANVIAECLRSIRGIQPADHEIVLVDDGSTDDSGEVIRKAVLTEGIARCTQIITQKNKGPGSARNTAIRAARGTWIACLDSDDLWLPWTLLTLTNILKSHPQTDVLFMRSKNLDIRMSAREITESSLKVGFKCGFLSAFLDESTKIYFSTNNFLCRRKILLDIGGFTEGLRVFEDQDLFLRLPPECNVSLVYSPIMVAYINTPNSLTKSCLECRAGLHWLRRAEHEGNYPGGSRKLRERRIFIARVAQFTIMNTYRNGSIFQSYLLMIQSAWELANNRCARFILRYHAMLLKDFIGRLISRKQFDQ